MFFFFIPDNNHKVRIIRYGADKELVFLHSKDRHYSNRHNENFQTFLKSVYNNQGNFQKTTLIIIRKTMPKSAKEIALALFREKGGWLRTRQALELSISPRTLYALRDSGQIIAENRGLYRLADMELSSHKDLIQVGMRVSKGVICLISALDFYGITTQIPHFVYLALPENAEKPRINYPPLRIFWLSQKVYKAGIQEKIVNDIPLKMYSLEKTITDSFKFRKKIGLDIALESLRQAVEEKRCDIDTLMQFARLNRVETLIIPYLEALL